MFGFKKTKNPNKNQKPISNAQPQINWFSQLKSGLHKTRAAFTDRLSQLVLGKKNIDQVLLDELESILLSADIGTSLTKMLLERLTEQVSRKDLEDPQHLVSALKKELLAILAPVESSMNINTQPFTILMVGVNGAGKTTTIAKLAHQFKQQGRSLMLAAGDTFRAAAIEQLAAWAEKNQVPMISQHSGADSASVVYDSLQAAQAKKIDILIADTAGRLHTQEHLSRELQKIKRVMGKIVSEAPHETLLVIDATIGQNAITQAEAFNESIGVDGIVLTKLDGSAKGGAIFAIAHRLNIPIRYIGVGEKMEDLKPFIAHEFVDALFSEPGQSELV